jgi:photosystem I subunit 8
MALRATIAKPAVRPQASRSSVKPVAALKPAQVKLAAAGVASLAVLAAAQSVSLPDARL